MACYRLHQVVVVVGQPADQPTFSCAVSYRRLQLLGSDRRLPPSELPAGWRGRSFGREQPEQLGPGTLQAVVAVVGRQHQGLVAGLAGW